MLIDTALAPSAAVATLEPPLVRTAAATEALVPMTAAADVLSLVRQAGDLVGGIDLDDGERWAAADAEVAATAATLRIAAAEFPEAAGLRRPMEWIDAIPVEATAPPVVRAREVGFLASALAAMLARVDEDEPAVASLLASVVERLGGDLRRLRQVLGTDPRTPCGERTSSAILQRWRRPNGRRAPSRS